MQNAPNENIGIAGRCTPSLNASIDIFQKGNTRMGGSILFLTPASLDMRDEGETSGFLCKEQEFHPGCACSDKQLSTHIFSLRNKLEIPVSKCNALRFMCVIYRAGSDGADKIKSAYT